MPHEPRSTACHLNLFDTLALAVNADTTDVQKIDNGQIVHGHHLEDWASLKDAEDAATVFINDPTAKRRNELGDMSLFAHYIKQ